MRTEINGDLISSGFSFISKVGLHLFINCKDRLANLNSYYCREDDKVTFWFYKGDEESNIVFHCETDLERELLEDTQRFDCQCKDQFEFLFVKFDDLKDRD